MGLVTLTRAVGLVMIGMGIGGYIGTGADSITALIPAVLGLAFVLIAKLAGELGWLNWLLWSGLSVAAVGLLGSLRVVSDLAAVLAGESVDRPAALTVQTVTIVLSAVLIGRFGRILVGLRRERILV